MPTNEHEIDRPDHSEYPDLIAIWEAAVRATHHFLSEEHIQYFKPLILHDYFPAVELYCIRNGAGDIMGFMGLSPDMVEMVFVHPQHFGKGVGKRLMNFAIHEKSIRKVDVNEQNLDALAFYRRLGFGVKSRSELDGSGMPYPILHLMLI